MVNGIEGSVTLDAVSHSLQFPSLLPIFLILSVNYKILLTPILNCNGESPLPKFLKSFERWRPQLLIIRWTRRPSKVSLVGGLVVVQQVSSQP